MITSVVSKDTICNHRPLRINWLGAFGSVWSRVFASISFRWSNFALGNTVIKNSDVETFNRCESYFFTQVANASSAATRTPAETGFRYASNVLLAKLCDYFVERIHFFCSHGQHSGRTKEPPRQCKPRVRWWWISKFQNGLPLSASPTVGSFCNFLAIPPSNVDRLDAVRWSVAVNTDESRTSETSHVARLWLLAHMR